MVNRLKNDCINPYVIIVAISVRCIAYNSIIIVHVKLCCCICINRSVNQITYRDCCQSYPISWVCASVHCIGFCIINKAPSNINICHAIVYICINSADLNSRNCRKRIFYINTIGSWKSTVTVSNYWIIVNVTIFDISINILSHTTISWKNTQRNAFTINCPYELIPLSSII